MRGYDGDGKTARQADGKAGRRKKKGRKNRIRNALDGFQTVFTGECRFFVQVVQFNGGLCNADDASFGMACCANI